MKLFKPLTVLLSALTAHQTAMAVEIKGQTFEAPFTDLDRSGKRTVASYSVDGDAQVMQHFIRLTPDRQSKSGALWAKENLPKDLKNLAATLTFMISGQGEKLYGDGIGLWLMQGGLKTGSLHGVNPKFTGMGIIIDTYVASERSERAVRTKRRSEASIIIAPSLRSSFVRSARCYHSYI